ncbi:MAG: hypothetical protein OHK0046_51430 [Anaerolineae bacterium]
MTYPQANTYTITLTVDDGSGNTPVTVQKQVQATAPLPELAADFNATETSPLTFDVAATASGGAGNYSYTWDFGDPSANPPSASGATASVTYPQANTYTITLTVDDGSGNTPVTVQKQVQATAPEPTPEEPQPSIVETTPVLPAIDPLIGVLTALHSTSSTNRDAFAVIGDQTTVLDTFLDPFAGIDAANDPRITAPGLREVIARYQADLGIGSGENSFNRQSVATGNLTAADLLDPQDEQLRNSPQCAGAETLIDCELNILRNPAIAIISVGYTDAIEDTDAATFEEQINAIIQRVLSRNVIPVVTTIYPNPDQQLTTIELNEAIIRAAEANQVPLINMWLAFEELPNALNDANQPAVAPEDQGGAALLSLDVTTGANARNLVVLTRLQEIISRIFG